MLFAVPKISETFLQLGNVDYDCTNGIGNLSHTTTHSFRNQGHEKQEVVLPPARLWAESRPAEPLPGASQAAGRLKAESGSASRIG